MFKTHIIAWITMVVVVGTLAGISYYYNMGNVHHVDDHTVICKAGFFYNMDTLTLEDVERMEDVYNSECTPVERDEELGQTDSRGEHNSLWGKPCSYTLYKQAVVIYDEPNQLVVNVRLSPESHKQVVNEAYHLNSETTELKPET